MVFQQYDAEKESKEKEWWCETKMCYCHVTLVGYTRRPAHYKEKNMFNSTTLFECSLILRQMKGTWSKAYGQKAVV